MAAPEQKRFFLFQWIDYFSTAGGIIASICMILVTGIILFEVVMRYCFNAPTVWVGEMSIYLCMGIGFFSLAHGLKNNSHFSITLLTDRLTPKRRIQLKMVTDLVGALYSTTFIFKGIELARFAYEIEDVSSGMMATPLWIPWSFVPVGGALLAAQFINKLVEDFQDLKAV
ncbi:MAG TPA: hypothetical protein DHV36_11535 [Desulfobacteraceae bacterium]|nr:hypothetical protein [Desulfobacteraceae bacterium]